MSHEAPSNANAQRSEYADRLQAILETPLTPENINTYADDALDRLVAVGSQAIAGYVAAPTITRLTAKDTETAAFSYYGMVGVEQALDHIAHLAADIHSLDDVTARATYRKAVIVPTDPTERKPIRRGDGNWEPKRILDRLKTTLFILEHDFGIDVHDPAEVVIDVGRVKPDMVRQMSFYPLEIPKLSRLILVCDEEGNASFVFNTDALQQEGIGKEEILARTKPQLKELIETNNMLGRRIRHSHTFVDNMRGSIISPVTSRRQRAATPVRYLDPEQAQDLYSERDIAHEIGMPYNTFRQKMRSVREQIVGEPVLVSHGRGLPQKMWSAAQKSQAIALLADTGVERVRVQAAPPEVKSINQLKNEWGGRRSTLRTALEELGEGTLGPLRKFKFGSNYDVGLLPEQQQILRQYLDSQRAPELHLTIGGIATQFGVDKDTVRRAVASLGDELEQNSKYYDPWQQNMIYDELTRRGEFLPKAPADYMSRGGFYETWGIRGEIFDEAVELLGDRLGEAPRFKFHAKRVPGYSPVQQQMIRAAVDTIRSQR